MKTIYVAGAYRWRGSPWVPPIIGEAINIYKAWKVSKMLWEGGFVAICPHTNAMFMDRFGIAPEVFLEGDLAILLQSDAIYMMEGWERSTGAVAEREFAIAHGIPVFHSFSGLGELLWQ